MSDLIVTCQHLAKRYHDAGMPVDVLRDISLTVNKGELIAIAGSSGSGKSTLLHLIGGLDKPSAGTVSIAGKNPATLTESARSKWRNLHLGFIYQFHHLLPEFSALENVGLPLLIRGESPKNIKPQALNLLKLVGLSDRVSHRPGELSGGERQRVAIARALVTKPSCILADEPTGNLDSRNAEIVLKLFIELQKTQDTAVLLVTHDIMIAKYADRLFNLEDGNLIPRENLKQC